MAYPSFEINITEGNLDRPAANVDNVAALVLSSCTVLDPMEPEVIYSVKQAEALGFSAAEDATSGLLHYEHIKEFFRMNPNGELHIVATAVTVTLSTMLGNSTTAGTLEPFIVAQNGRIKQLAIMATAPAVDWFDEHFDTNDGVAQAQAFCDRLRVKHVPLDVLFLEGHGFDYTAATAPDLRAKNAPNVAVVIGGDYAVSSSMSTLFGQGYAAVGTVLGSSTNKEVHQSFAWSKPENAITSGADERFLKVRYVSNMTVDDPYAADPLLLMALHDKGYIFPRQVPFVSGFYWNQSNNCVPVTNDINSIELMQVINKAIRIVGVAIAPYINRDYALTADGRLTPLERQSIVAVIRTALETNMGNSVSALPTIIVDPATDDNQQPYPSMVVDPTLRVKLGIQPRGKSELIIFDAGYRA